MTYWGRVLLSSKTLPPSHAPLLVWVASSNTASTPSDPDNLTLGGANSSRPTATDPLVFELRKSENKANAFALGITVGRILTNDIVIDDSTVSRFHAYFKQDRQSLGWMLVDAGSSNGTALNGARLTAEKPEAVPDGARITFGSVVTIFYLPQTFLGHLNEVMP